MRRDKKILGWIIGIGNATVASVLFYTAPFIDDTTQKSIILLMWLLLVSILVAFICFAAHNWGDIKRL